MLDLAAIRRDIPALERSVFLNTGGIGPTPRPVHERLLNEFTETYLNGAPVFMRPQSVQMEEDRARQELARFIGAAPQDICFTRGVSDGANIVMGGLGWQPGDELITTDEEHPAFLMPIMLLKQRFGIVVRTLELANSAETLLERFQNLLSPRTRLAAFSHVTTDNGLRLPVRDMCASACDAGVPVFLDGAQSVGQFPVDVREIGCAFFGALSYKWLLGPYSAGVLYLDEAWRDRLEVTMTGARAERGMDRATGQITFAEGARRFEFGPRALPLHLAMVEAAHYLEGIGLEAIEAHVQTKTTWLREALRAIPKVRVLSPETPDLATGVVNLEIEGLRGQEVCAALRNRWNIVTRSTHLRSDGVRVSVAFFTTDEELETLLHGVQALAAGR